MMRRHRIGTALAAALLAAACGRFDNQDKAPAGKERMVSVSKQYTEITFALGAEDNLVAVDVSSVYPPAARQLPTVGYHRALSLEGMLSAKPTLILRGGPNNIGPEHVVRQLESLNIAMKDFTLQTGDIEGTKALIREMGAFFHKEARAEELVAKLDTDMKQALDPARQTPDTPRVVIIHYGQANNVYLTMTAGSTAGKMIAWAGGRIAIGDSGSMRQLSSPEIIAKANPDVILLTDFGYDRLAGRADILALPGVGSTKAARTGRIFRVEENDLVYFGPRTGENVLKLRELIRRPGDAQ
jgi:iron complex transport system substrate-binding protein